MSADRDHAGLWRCGVEIPPECNESQRKLSPPMLSFCFHASLIQLRQQSCTAVIVAGFVAARAVLHVDGLTVVVSVYKDAYTIQ